MCLHDIEECGATTFPNLEIVNIGNYTHFSKVVSNIFKGFQFQKILRK